jgi:SAM-dependent methyltransferase
LSDALPYFDAQAEKYETHADLRPEFNERFALWAAAIDRALPAGGVGATAIDLGCGPGHLTYQLAARGCHTIAIDGSEAMLARTRERVLQHGITRTDLRRHTLPLPDEVPEELAGQADLILMSSVIEYISDDHKVMRQCARLLRPGGHLLISFPNRQSLYWRAQRVLKHTPLFAESASRYQRRQYDAASVQVLARAAGMQVQWLTFFALPLQRYTKAISSARRPRLATLFMADLQRVG